MPEPAPAVLTFLIADVRGYTSFTRDAGDEAAARLAATFAEIVREGVEARDGRVIELRGDEALAVFNSPRQALRAAVDLQGVFLDERTLDASVPLRVGIGLDAGEAVPVEDGYRGGALNLAARLCSVAGPDEIVASPAVVQLARAVAGVRTEPRPPVELKGLREPVEAFSVRSGGPSSTIAAGRPRSVPPAPVDPVTPLIGRDAVARWSRWAWRQARRGDGRGIAIVGRAGSGKTRLAAEPVEIAARDGASIHYASGASPAGEIATAVDDTLADRGPGLIVLDDLESASGADLAAVERLADDLAGRPILVVALASEPIADHVARPLRRLAGDDATRRLGPLDEPDIAMIVRLYAADSSDPAPIRSISEASGGLPSVVHRLAADWAQGEVSRRLGVAASRAADGRRDLRRYEDAVATNVVDLQLARERHRLYQVDAAAAVGAVEACPFKGLTSFETVDADVFFGRERLVAEMVGRLAGTTFLGVVGPSGSGKSSAVRAGLLPALASGALPGSERWVQVVLRPGERPMRELDRAVFAALPETDRGGLGSTDDPLGAMLAIIGEGRSPLVVVDQFEELFTTTADVDERARFIASLTQAAASGRAVVVVAIRADFYGRCAEDPGLTAALGSAHVLVGPMTADEYRRVIEGPIRGAGLRFDPSLVDTLVNEVVDEPGGLPLLSTALVELWGRREGRVIRMAAHAATGGVRGAVGRLAEAAYGHLTEPQQGMARSIFLRLSSGEGEAVVRQRVALSDFDAATNADVGETLAVLTDARLLTVGEGSVEVAHEALLREWSRLSDWLEEDREGRRLRRHLAESAREWATAGRDAGELYRGARLSAVIDWTTDHTLELNELERQFVAESRATTERESDRQRRTNRRLRVLLVAAAGALVIAVGAGGVALLQRGEAERAAAEAQAQRTEAEAQRTSAEEAAIAADAQRLGAQALVAKDLDLSLLLARQGYDLDDSPATRANLLAAVSQSPAAIGIWRPLDGRLLEIWGSDDGSTLVVTNNGGRSAIVDGATGATRFVHEWQEDRWVTVAGDGTIVVLRGERGSRRLGLLDPIDGSELGEFTYPAGHFGVHWSPDLRQIGFGTPAGDRLIIQDRATGATVRTLRPPPGMSFFDPWMAHGGYLMATLIDGPLPDDFGELFASPATLAWYGPTGDVPISTVRIPSLDRFWRVDPTGRYLAVDNMPEDGQETIFDLTDGEGHRVRGQHASSVQGAAFSPDGRLLVTGGDDLLARVWDTESGELRETLTGHNGRVFWPAFYQREGELVVYTVSLDGSMMAWDLAGGRRFSRTFDAGSLDILDHQIPVAFAPDGRTFAVGRADGVAIFDAVTRALLRTLPIAGDGAFDLVWSPDGSNLVVVGSAGLVERWDAATWTSLGRLEGPPSDREARPDELDPDVPGDDGRRPNTINAVAVAEDGAIIAAGGDDGHVWIWNGTTGAPTGISIDVGEPVLDLDFDPTATRIVASHGSIATVFELPVEATAYETAYEVDVDEGYGAAFAVAFSPDGATLATGGGTGEVRFWDAASGAPTGRSVRAASGWVLSIDWDPSGSWLVSGGTDGTVRLVDFDLREVVGNLPGIPDNEWVSARYRPDGQRIIGVYAGGDGFDWSPSPTDWSARACEVAGRTLTREEWERYLPDRAHEPACD